MRILHLATDDKFIDHAFPLFEHTFPNSNDVIIFSNSANLKYVKVKTLKTILVTPWKLRKPRIENLIYQPYDLVVFHSFNNLIYPEVFNIPLNTPTIWLGWGFDYYYDIFSRDALLLDKTAQTYSNIRSGKLIDIFRHSRDVFHDYLIKLRFQKSKFKAIEKISVFSPVLPKEYELLFKSHKWDAFPQYARWNYGTIEDNLIRGFEDDKINGDGILVGNSSSFTCNNIEALELLQRIGVDGRKIVAPLSYGNKRYGEIVKTLGSNYFGENFIPLLNFIPIQEYVSIIKKCGFVVMNHKRQQAVGNIVIMLYLGAKVFVREENPVFQFFEDLGVSVSTIQELENKPEMLQAPLSPEERKSNRQIVSEYWSREKALERTKSIVEKAISLKCNA